MADHKKIKTCFAQIIVEEIAGKPYYSIMYWHGIGMHIGYSSYELENVRQWLNEEFEVNRNADVAPVVHGRWGTGRFNPETGNYEEQCTRCRNFSKEYGKPYCPNCGAKMDGGAE
jgi:hypothetical protein